jgi:hypothetical protein
MRKGTLAVQNIKAQKYLKELGIRSLSNLITDHPKSTEMDIRETKRVLENISHLEPFQLSFFELSHGSALYNELTPEEKEKLVLTRQWLDRKFAEYSVADAQMYSTPATLGLGKELHGLWDELRDWYEGKKSAYKKNMPVCSVEVIGENRLQILDTRFGRMTSIEIEGDKARIYDACHEGLSIERLKGMFNFDEQYLLSILNDLLEKRLILEVDNQFLSLATRARDVLVKRYFTLKEQSTQRSAVVENA